MTAPNPTGAWIGVQYKRGDPTIWMIGLGRIALGLTSTHTDHPGKWVANCAPFLDDEVICDVGEFDADMVKAAALGVFMSELRRTLQIVEGASKTAGGKFPQNQPLAPIRPA